MPSRNESLLVDLSLYRWTPRGGWSPELPDPVDDARTAVLSFASAMLEEVREPLADLARAFPSAARAGCSTSGVVAGVEVGDDPLVAVVARFDHVDVRLATVESVDLAGSHDAGRRIGEALAHPDLKSVFTVTDGLTVLGQPYVQAMQAVLGEGVLISGGLAGDGDRFVTTWVSAGDEAGNGRVAAIGFYGDRLEVGVGTASGWRSFGPPREVTASDGNVLHTIDGQPALALYRRYLGRHAEGLPAAALRFPLALYDADRAQPVVRAVLGVDEAGQTLTFGGDLPVGQRVSLTYAAHDAVIDAAAQAAEGSLQALGPADGPVLALPVSCIARRLVLGEGVDEEIEALAEVLPEGTVMAGFYSYGELAPMGEGPCELHNQTMTLTVLRERS